MCNSRVASVSVPIVESDGSSGILNVRERDGMADLPERSLSRLLAVDHIVSLVASSGIQVRGLDIILVR